MKKLLISCLACCFAAGAVAQPLAFPGAEGAGRFAKGGRGGDVYHVTNLKDDGEEGSLRYGIEKATGPRTIVFDVSGTIQLARSLKVRKSFLTIAGQTAPGDGITLRDFTLEFREASDLVVRFIRVRYGDKNKEDGNDATAAEDVSNSIFDHLSVSWGIDAEHDARFCKDITWQWCIFGEALNNSIHPERKKPENKGVMEHAMMGSWRDMRGDMTMHHCLIACCRERHPNLAASGTDPQSITNFSNNVMFNQVGATSLGQSLIIVEGNYYKPGKLSDFRKKKPVCVKTPGIEYAFGWMTGNHFEGYSDYNKDNYVAVDYSRWEKHGTTTREAWELKTKPDYRYTGFKLESAQDAFNSVLAKAGASYFRDSVDQRITAGVRDGSLAMIDSQDQVGGWPVLRSKKAPLDTDGDGMPDEWEIAHKLNPKDPSDGNGYKLSKEYTNLEVYLNGLVADIIK